MVTYEGQNVRGKWTLLSRQMGMFPLRQRRTGVGWSGAELNDAKSDLESSGTLSTLLRTE